MISAKYPGSNCSRNSNLIYLSICLFVVTGVTASTDTIEAQAKMGMSLLAGSTIMLLTLIWGSVIAFGSYDLSQPSDSSDVENKRPFSLSGFPLLSSLTNIKHLCSM